VASSVGTSSVSGSGGTVVPSSGSGELDPRFWTQLYDQHFRRPRPSEESEDVPAYAHVVVRIVGAEAESSVGQVSIPIRAHIVVSRRSVSSAGAVRVRIQPHIGMVGVESRSKTGWATVDVG
jgi:hypothetical protein